MGPAEGVGGRSEGGAHRVLVSLTGAPGADRLIERARRMAAQAGGELIGVHVRSGRHPGQAARRRLADQQRRLEELGGAYREVAGDNVAEALLAVARAEGATQLVVGASRRSRWQELIRGSVLHELVRAAEGMDVHVIATSESARQPRLLTGGRPSGVGSRRRRIGYLLGAVGLVALTAVLNLLEQQLALSSILLLYLALVVGATAVGGGGPAVLTTLGAFGLADFFFTQPYHTFVIDEASVLVALVVFASVPPSSAGWSIMRPAGERRLTGRMRRHGRSCG